MGTEGIQDRYINPYTTFGFKLLFGTTENKELLISFLNTVLPEAGTVTDIDFVDPELLEIERCDRHSALGICCTNKKGELFLVELQRGEFQFLDYREVFYSTFSIGKQADQGKWYADLKSLYVICVLSFPLMYPDTTLIGKEVLSNHPLVRHFQCGEKHFIYLEMPKFSKGEDELETMLDKWLFVIRNLSCLSERPHAFREHVFDRLFEVAEMNKNTQQELERYWGSLKNFRDWYSVLSTNIRKGREEGLEKGAQEKRLEIARNFKSIGLSVEQIMEGTGLSKEEIEQL